MRYEQNRPSLNFNRLRNMSNTVHTSPNKQQQKRKEKAYEGGEGEEGVKNE